MAHPNTTSRTTRLDEAVTVLFCLVDDPYRILNPCADGDGDGRVRRAPRVAEIQHLPPREKYEPDDLIERATGRPPETAPTFVTSVPSSANCTI